LKKEDGRDRAFPPHHPSALCDDDYPVRGFSHYDECNAAGKNPARAAIFLLIIKNGYFGYSGRGLLCYY